MNGIIKEKVRLSGYKQKFLAEQLDIHPQFFSMVMRGERNLSLKKEAELRELLKHVQLPTTQVA